MYPTCQGLRVPGYTIMGKPDDLLSLSAAARVAELSAVYLRRLADEGKVVTERTTSGTRLFRRKHIEAFMRRRAARPPLRGRPPHKKPTKRTTKSKEKRSTQ
jgi:hypothetical protein